MIERRKNTQAETDEVIAKIVTEFDCELIIGVQAFEGKREVKHINPEWLKEEG